MRYVVTGGAGFIGSSLVRFLIEKVGADVLVIDKLTYAGNLHSLERISGSGHYSFLHADICETDRVGQALNDFKPQSIIHLAAESHVDRSIAGASDFIRTNVVGTFSLLEVARHYWNTLTPASQQAFRFVHVSTDEVYGSLPAAGLFRETTPYDPSSPYSASKAAADHLALAWHRTHGLPVVVSNCSNNYGPFQYPEKLIPLTILNAFHGKKLPIYGTGKNVRDWLHVDDHTQALYLISMHGRPGRKYNVGGGSEYTNIAVVTKICALMDEFKPRGTPHSDLISLVPDRLGHDARYAIDPTRIETELGWRANIDFETGLRQTVRWYLDNARWWQSSGQKPHEIAHECAQVNSCVLS